MSTFDTILQKIDHRVFMNDLSMSGVQELFLSSLVDSLTHNAKTKFRWLGTSMDFYCSDRQARERNSLIYYFCAVQKVYHTLTRLCIAYKRKKARLVVTEDLHMNQVNACDEQVLTIYHGNNAYLFKASDLLKMAYNALTHYNGSFCAEPRVFKNPYNNVPFGKSVLYYIGACLAHRVRLKWVNPIHVDIFLKFQRVHFDLTSFLRTHEVMLREHAIQNYVTNSTDAVLKRDILLMLDQYNTRQSASGIVPDANVPEADLVTILKPYLKLYLTTHFSLVPKTKCDAMQLLDNKLTELRDFNPMFGRKMMVMKEKQLKGKLVQCKTGTGFNLKHKPFDTCSVYDFMTSHLQVNIEHMPSIFMWTEEEEEEETHEVWEEEGEEEDDDSIS